MLKRLVLVFALIILLCLALASCDIVNSLVGKIPSTDSTPGTVSDNEDDGNSSENKNGDNGDISNPVEELRRELRSFMKNEWAAVVLEFNYKILTEPDKEAFNNEYSAQISALDSAKNRDELDAIRSDFNRLTGKIYGNEVVNSYVKEEFKGSVMHGQSLRSEVIKNLVGKTFCIEKTYTGVEEHTITAEFIAAYEGEVLLNEYEALIGLPVPFDEGAYYAGIELKFDGAPDVSNLDAVLTYNIADANPFGWKSLTVYGESYVDGLGKTIINAGCASLDNGKFVYYNGSEDAAVITYNGWEIFFAADKDKSELKFERPSSDLMKTLTYENDGAVYIFNIYGVMNPENTSYKTTADITYQNGKVEKVTSYCYLGAYSDTENGFAFSLLGIESLAYTDDGVLSEIPSSSVNEK